MKWIVLGLLFCLFCGSAFAFPQLLPVQGKLKGNNAGDVNKQLPMTFSFYSTATGGTAFWTETRYVDVNITDIDENIGVFSVLLGDAAWLDVNSHSDWNYLGITIQSNSEMAPRIRLGAAAYSFISEKALSVDEFWFYSHDTNGGVGSNLPDTTCDNNAACKTWLFGLDWNSTLQRKADLNANWYGKLDVNNQFVPYIGAVRDINIGNYDFNTRGTLVGGKFKSADANSVYGTNAVALGATTTAFGQYSTALGWSTTSTGYASTAIGDETKASGIGSIAGGYNDAVTGLEASGEGSIALGDNYGTMRASGSGSIAMGYCNDILQSGGIGSIAMGYNTKAFGIGSVSLGYDTNANADYATAIGYQVFNNKTKSVALGLDVNVARDLNVNRAIQAGYFFGNGAGLTGLTGTADGFTATLDVNAAERVYLFGQIDWNSQLQRRADLNNFFVQLQNIYSYDSNTDTACDGNTVLTGNGICQSITDFYLSSGNISDTNFQTFVDFNKWYWSKYDLNGSFYGKQDINANWYGKLDVNNQYVPYIGADYDVNLGIYGIKASNSVFTRVDSDWFLGKKITVTTFSTIGNGEDMENGLGVGDLNVQDDVYTTHLHSSNIYATSDSNTATLGTGNLFVNATSKPYAVITKSGENKFFFSSDAMGVPQFYTDYTGIDFVSQNIITTGAGRFGDLNSPGSDNNIFVLGVYKIFGDGSGLTNLPSGLTWNDINAHVYGKLDVNAHFAPKLNASFLGDTNAMRIEADYFFGNGAGLTGVTASTNWADINAHVYGKLDVNAGFVPYVGATKNINIGNYGLTAKDLNASSGVKATGLFSTIAKIGTLSIGSGSITDSSDAIDFGNAVLTTGGDILVTVGVVSTAALSASSDSNLTNVEADYFFGNGSGLTNVSASTNWADINAHVYGKLDVNTHFVPYIGATRDVNLNSHDLNAFTVLGNKFRMPTTSASGSGAVAFGSATGNIIASGIGSLAAGRAFGANVPIWATDEGSIAMGYAVGAEGIKSTAFGSIAMGYGGTSGVKSGGLGSISLGFDTKAFGIGAISIGSDTNANCTTGCVAIGYQTINTTDNSVALGLDVNVARTLKVMQDVNISKGVNKGVSISGDVNRICFPSNSCEMYIDFNGTAFIFGS